MSRSRETAPSLGVAIARQRVEHAEQEQHRGGPGIRDSRQIDERPAVPAATCSARAEPRPGCLQVRRARASDQATRAGDVLAGCKSYESGAVTHGRAPVAALLAPPSEHPRWPK